MKIITLLFTYNRSYHTEQVLNALSQNTVLPQKMLIFQDGLCEGHDSREWNKVNEMIHNIDWCDTETIVSKDNKGVASSIVSGINLAFKEYDAVIVLEDDCVPSVNFINFMQQCFEKYQEDENVYSVSGYSWPIRIEKGQYDIYGCGRISSWGWGTWKERWKKYRKDESILKHLKKENSLNLAIWGSDCEKILLESIDGLNDAWDVYWALNVIENEGICINPYESLIQNIGHDGSGMHCGKTNEFQVKVSNKPVETFRLPEKICILNEIKKVFAEFIEQIS